MKTVLAVEKSEYSHCLMILLNDHLGLEEHQTALARIKEIEQQVKSKGDEIIFIVTTRDTNPMKKKTAPAMTMDNINKTK